MVFGVPCPNTKVGRNTKTERENLEEQKEEKGEEEKFEGRGVKRSKKIVRNKRRWDLEKERGGEK